MRYPLILLMATLALTAATVFRMFWGLSAAPAERWDEETNIQVITQTIEHRTFPLLILDNAPFFEKPPLWYFVQIGIATFIGVHLSVLRAVSAISGVLIIFITVLFSWRRWGYVSGITTWIVLLTSHQLYTTNLQGFFSTHTLRSADMDALHILFLVLAFLSSVTFEPVRSRPYLTGIFSGLAMLAKSPLGILPLVITTIVHRKHARHHKALVHSWITMICVIFPWYAWMTVQFGGDFLFSHIGYHIQTRTFFSIEGHNNSWEYFIALLGNPHIYPWAIFLLISIVWILIHPKLRTDKILLPLTILVILLFTIPTSMQTRLAWYILPLYPFAALLLGNMTGRVIRKVRIVYKSIYPRAV